MPEGKGLVVDKVLEESAKTDNDSHQQKVWRTGLTIKVCESVHVTVCAGLNEHPQDYLSVIYQLT